MIDINYKKIAKIIELADYEIERLDARRPKPVLTSIIGLEDEPAFGREEPTESVEQIRFRKERELLVELKKDFEAELDKIVFKFGAHDNQNVFKSN